MHKYSQLYKNMLRITLKSLKFSFANLWCTLAVGMGSSCSCCLYVSIFLAQRHTEGYDIVALLGFRDWEGAPVENLGGCGPRPHIKNTCSKTSHCAR